MSSQTTWLPMIPIPAEDYTAKRIQQLKDSLYPQHAHYARPGQHKNIRKLIELYETGQMTPDKDVWILEGELTDMKTAVYSPGWALSERTRPYHQYINKCAYTSPMGKEHQV